MSAGAFATFELDLAVQSMLMWAVAFVMIVLSVRKTSEAFFNKMPAAKAYIPSTLPHPNPDGDAVPFPLKLTDAPPEKVLAFMKFREISDWKTGDSLDAVAVEAAKYKGEQFDEKVLKWEHEHFQLRKKGLSFPFPAKHWNGWAGFWSETGSYKRGVYEGNLALGLEHVLCGLVLPMLYLRTSDPWYFAWSMYGDIGANVVSNCLILASYATGKNYLLEKYSRAVWHLLATHHCCAICLCWLGLLYGEATPRDLSCLLIVSLLGTTGAMHLFGTALDLTPWGIEDAPWLRCTYQMLTLSTMLWFRVVYWVVLLYQLTVVAYAKGGLLVGAFTLVVLLLFTAFNADFVGFHYKAAIAMYKRAFDIDMVRTMTGEKKTE